MPGKPLLELGHAGESTIPASLQLTSDEAVLGIGRVILSEGPISSVPRRLEITDQGRPRLVTLDCGLRLGRSCSLHGVNCTTVSSAASTTSSTRSPLNAMQLGSP
jgi:hypothetical protein